MLRAHHLLSAVGLCLLLFSPVSAFPVESPRRSGHFAESPKVHDAAVDALLGKDPEKGYALFRYRDAVKVITPLPSERRLDVLMTVYFEVPDRRVRRTVIELIASCCKDSGRLIDAWCAISEDADVRIACAALHELAILASSGRSDPTVMAKVASSLLRLADESNPDIETRSSAIGSLGVLIEKAAKDDPLVPKVATTVSRAIETDSPELVRAGSAVASAVWGDDALAHIKPILAKSPPLAEMAALSIAELKSPEGLALLKVSYEETPSLRQALKDSLRMQLGGQRARDFFTHIDSRDSKRPLAFRMDLPVSAVLIHVPGKAAMEQVAEKAHIDLDLPPDGDFPEEPLSVSLTNVPFRIALHELCYRCGVTFTSRGERVVVTKGDLPALGFKSPAVEKKLGETRISLELQTGTAELVLRQIQRHTDVKILLSPSAARRFREVSTSLSAESEVLGKLLRELAERTKTDMVVNGCFVEFR